MKLTNRLEGWVVLAGALIATIFIVWWFINHLFLATDTKVRFVEGPHVFYGEEEMVIKKLVAEEKTARIDTVSVPPGQSGSVRPVVLEVPSSGDVIDISLKDEIKDQPWRYDQPTQVMVLSDLEGNFVSFKQLLIAGEVIDDALEWTFGDGHLVILGDVFDRGTYVTECLWFIYYLENQAEKYGGRVHLLLGNHELMVLSGDLRYSRKKYRKIADLLKRSYADLFASDTELGRWLRSKNTVIQLGDMVYCHAGISPFMAPQYDADYINRVVRTYLHSDEKEVYAMDHAGVLGSSGPLWYRGYFDGSVSQATVEEVLRSLDASTMVIGHTVVNEVQKLYDGRIVAVDVVRASGDEFSALLINRSQFFTLDERGNRREL